MAKPDPRADPVSSPPDAPKPTADFSIDRVVVSKTAKKATISEAGEDESENLVHESSVVAVGDADKRDDEIVPTKKITSEDPRYEPLEKLLDLNDWRKIGDELGAIGEVGKLPPNLGLLAALAHNENAKDGDPEAVVTAIRCMAGLLGVAEDSPIARVLARRLLRKNPVKLRDRRAPPARTSLVIVVVTLVVGGGVGWLASIGSWRGIVRLLQ